MDLPMKLTSRWMPPQMDLELHMDTESSYEVGN